MISSARRHRFSPLLAGSLAVAACGPSTAPPRATAPSTSGTTVVFACADGKRITATFHPESDAYVDIVLSDGRSARLPRAMAASGARYATSDEGMVFWNKGKTAFITEGGEDGRATYSACEHRE